MDKISELKQLSELHQKGELSDEEFAANKLFIYRQQSENRKRRRFFSITVVIAALIVIGILLVRGNNSSVPSSTKSVQSSLPQSEPSNSSTPLKPATAEKTIPDNSIQSSVGIGKSRQFFMDHCHQSHSAKVLT